MRVLPKENRIGIKLLDVAKLLFGRRQRMPIPRLDAHRGVNGVREHGLGFFFFVLGNEIGVAWGRHAQLF